MRKAILLISLMLLASSAVADEAQKLHELSTTNGSGCWAMRPKRPRASATAALGYKIGELNIKELRAKAQRELGPKFDSLLERA